ncbi:hypothetical protein L1F30_03845 [Simiduia sp. 21SJ11W-1]|uniref:hypothetical protein n=1 Tax=Simiduia sp. 21SJ11W-1 TaxID=2909669 RepID=UPI0020A1A4B4|nr:hypothetical protein [Simiduia sp. 21SJ11W-1]UTA48680.1 hypothetical protein L1F30_03845 [Simiduia sp. 21SJ11W-1]
MAYTRFVADQSLDNQLSESRIGTEVRRLEQRIHQLQQASPPDTAAIASLANQLRERLMVLHWSRGHRQNSL